MIRPSLAALALATGLAAVGAPAAAQPTIVQKVEFVPRTPTTQDAVEIEVRGTSACLVTVDEVSVTYRYSTPDPHLVTVALKETCILEPPVARPFVATARVGHLPPDFYAVRIEVGESAVEYPMRVFRRADVAVRFTGEPFTNVEPVDLEIFLHGNPDTIRVAHLVTQRVIEIVLDRGGPSAAPTGEPSARRVPISFGPLPAGDYEVLVLDPQRDSALTHRITVHDAAGCVPSGTILCLGDGRFQVEVDWRDFENRSGPATAVPLSDRDDTGAFWFFHENNLELTVKVLDGCGVNGHRWVFLASGSTVGYDIAVTDTESGQVRRYGNDLGQVPNLVPDTTAFATCP